MPPKKIGGAEAVTDPKSDGPTFRFVDLPPCVQDQVAAVFFAEFSSSLTAAISASKEDLPEPWAGDAYDLDWREVDMQSVFKAIKAISKPLTVSKGVNEIFRPYYITAVFRTIVSDSSLVLDDGTQILRGISFNDRVIEIDECASEISALLTLVNAPCTLSATGGMRSLMTIPKYHSRNLRYFTSGYLSKGQAKEIFLLRDDEINQLPNTGRWRTSFGWCYPKHIRDCAAAALARLGSFKKLAEQSKLFDTPRLHRVHKVLDGLLELHATATGAKHHLVKTKKPQLIKDLERNKKRLVDRKKMAQISVRTYPVENQNIIRGLVDYINGKDEKEEKKRKLQDEKEAKKKSRALDAELLQLGPTKPPKRAKSAYATFAADVGGALKQANSDKSSADITKLKKQQWKQLSDEAKLKYEQASAADQLRFETETAAIQQSLKCNSYTATAAVTAAVAAVSNVGHLGTTAAQNDAVSSTSAFDQKLRALKSMLLADTIRDRLLLLRTGIRGQSAKSSIVTIMLSQRGLVHRDNKLVSKFVTAGEHEEEALSAIQAAADCELAVLAALHKASIIADKSILPFVPEVIALLLSNNRLTKARTNVLIAAVSKVLDEEQQILSSWHHSVVRYYRRDRSRILALTNEHECNLRRDNVIFSAIKKKISVLDSSSAICGDLNLNHTLVELKGFCLEKTVEDRAADLKQAIKCAKTTRHAQPHLEILVDFVDFSKRTTVQDNILTEYLHSSPESYSLNACCTAMQDMLSREEMLEAALHDRYSLEDECSLAFVFARTASVSKKFVIDDHGSLGSVVDCLSAMIADEKDALRCFCNPEMLTWWIQYNREDSIRDTVHLNGARSTYGGNWRAGSSFTDRGLDMGDWQKLFFSESKEHWYENSIIRRIWTQCYYREYQYGSQSSWMSPFFDKAKAIALATPGQVEIDEETELKTRVYDADATKRLVGQLANEDNDPSQAWFDDMIASFSKECWNVRPWKSENRTTLDKILAPESVRHAFERLIRTDIDEIVAQMNMIEEPDRYGRVGGLPQSCFTAVRAFKTAADDIIARKKSLSVKQPGQNVDMGTTAKLEAQIAYKVEADFKNLHDILCSENKHYLHSSLCWHTDSMRFLSSSAGCLRIEARLEAQLAVLGHTASGLNQYRLHKREFLLNALLRMPSVDTMLRSCMASVLPKPAVFSTENSASQRSLVSRSAHVQQDENDQQTHETEQMELMRSAAQPGQLTLMQSWADSKSEHCVDSEDTSRHVAENDVWIPLGSLDIDTAEEITMGMKIAVGDLEKLKAGYDEFDDSWAWKDEYAWQARQIGYVVKAVDTHQVLVKMPIPVAEPSSQLKVAQYAQVDLKTSLYNSVRSAAVREAAELSLGDGTWFSDIIFGADTECERCDLDSARQLLNLNIEQLYDKVNQLMDESSRVLSDCDIEKANVMTKLCKAIIGRKESPSNELAHHKAALVEKFVADAVDAEPLRDADQTRTECIEIISLDEDDLRNKIIKMKSQTDIPSCDEKQLVHRTNMIKLAVAVYTKLPSTAQLITAWRKEQQQQEVPEEQTVDTFAELLCSSDKDLGLKLATVESLQEADPGNEMLKLKVKIIRRCIGGPWRIEKPLRPIARLNAVLADSCCDVDDGENTSNGEPSKNYLRKFHLSALRMTVHELREKHEESQRTLLRNRVQNLRSVNPALAADRELAENYKSQVYAACHRRKLAPGKFQAWVSRRGADEAAVFDSRDATDAFDPGDTTEDGEFY